MRTIGVVTVARSDYGIYQPVLRCLQQEPSLNLNLIIGGMHLSPEFGLTVQNIEKDGFQIGERVEMLLSSETPEAIAKSMGLGTIGFAQAFARSRPDILLVLGDRFEMHSSVIAALPFNIPVAHIAGGESTEGAMDDSIRHSITKLSHLHFASTDEYAERIIQMGEEPWRVEVTGLPSLDNLKNFSLLNSAQIKSKCGLDLKVPFLLVTIHPVTLDYESTEINTSNLLSALKNCKFNVIFTYPNADTNSRIIIRMIHEAVKVNQQFQVADNLGIEIYFSLLHYASAMVGNSSSGITEAASFKLPVVNIGNRQKGRVCGHNVIHVGHSQAEILAGIKRAVSNHFAKSLENLTNPYGDGFAAQKIIDRLRKIKIDQRLLMKRFHCFQAMS